MKVRSLLLLCIIAALCLAGCEKDGADDSGSDTPKATATPTITEAPKGTVESWGIYKEIFIPEGMKLTPGSQLDKEDPNGVWVQQTSNLLNYYLFIVSTEEQCVKDVEATKEYNKESNPEDVTLMTGDIAWKGVTYKYQGTTDVAQMYAVIGDKVINVRFGGFAYDSDITKSILGSLKLD